MTDVPQTGDILVYRYASHTYLGYVSGIQISRIETHMRTRFPFHRQEVVILPYDEKFKTTYPISIYKDYYTLTRDDVIFSSAVDQFRQWKKEIENFFDEKNYILQ